VGVGTGVEATIGMGVGVAKERLGKGCNGKIVGVGLGRSVVGSGGKVIGMGLVGSSPPQAVKPNNIKIIKKNPANETFPISFFILYPSFLKKVAFPFDC
jgi:hypothetical protein